MTLEKQLTKKKRRGLPDMTIADGPGFGYSEKLARVG